MDLPTAPFIEPQQEQLLSFLSLGTRHVSQTHLSDIFFVNT